MNPAEFGDTSTFSSGTIMRLTWLYTKCSQRYFISLGEFFLFFFVFVFNHITVLHLLSSYMVGVRKRLMSQGLFKKYPVVTNRLMLTCRQEMSSGAWQLSCLTPTPRSPSTSPHESQVVTCNVTFSGDTYKYEPISGLQKHFISWWLQLRRYSRWTSNRNGCWLEPQAACWSILEQDSEPHCSWCAVGTLHGSLFHQRMNVSVIGWLWQAL